MRNFDPGLISGPGNIGAGNSKYRGAETNGFAFGIVKMQALNASSL